MRGHSKWLQCDSYRCSHIRFTVAGDRGWTETYAQAREAGWSVYKDGSAFCPNHRTRRTAPPAED